MNEHDLLDLRSAHPPGLPTCRPVADVLSRGTRLRRRRHTVRTAGATAVVGAVVTAGMLAVPDGPDATTAPGEPTPPAELLPAPRPLCDPASSPAGFDTAGDLARLPGWLPPGVELDDVALEEVTTECPTPDPALALVRMRADGRVGASLLVHGPFDGWAELPDPPTPTRVRGVDAGTNVYADAGIRSVDLVWTDGDGASWWVVAHDVDEAEVRSIVEALVLDSRRGSVPAATVPTGRLHDGWEVTWQAPDTPVVGRSTRLAWSVTTADQRCGVDLIERAGQAPARAVLVEAGAEPTTVDGHDAMALPAVDGIIALVWSEPSGTDVTVWCRDLPLADVRRIADSLEPVAPGDPRLPD